MNILITGGTGLIGKRLATTLIKENHIVNILTRGKSQISQGGANYYHWDGRSTEGWESLASQTDAIINLAGEPLTRWPWTKNHKRRFLDSRVYSGQALIEAISATSYHPKILIQISGINHYGLRGLPADESTLPGTDFLSKLTQEWEGATSCVEELNIRRCVVRLAVVLSNTGGLLPTMAFPVRAFLGGPIGSGKQVVPWIHIDDVIGAICFLLKKEEARGIYNLVAPEITTNALFIKTLARKLNRPYWIRLPAFLLKIILGEMSVMIIEGRGAIPRRLLEDGYEFKFCDLQSAIDDLMG